MVRIHIAVLAVEGWHPFPAAPTPSLSHIRRGREEKHGAIGGEGAPLLAVPSVSCLACSLCGVARWRWRRAGSTPPHKVNIDTRHSRGRGSEMCRRWPCFRPPPPCRRRCEWLEQIHHHTPPIVGPAELLARKWNYVLACLSGLGQAGRQTNGRRAGESGHAGAKTLSLGAARLHIAGKLVLALVPLTNQPTTIFCPVEPWLSLGQQPSTHSPADAREGGWARDMGRSGPLGCALYQVQSPKQSAHHETTSPCPRRRGK